MRRIVQTGPALVDSSVATHRIMCGVYTRAFEWSFGIKEDGKVMKG